MSEYGPTAEREQSEEQTADEPTPAEVFDREGDTVAVATTRSQATDLTRPRRVYGDESDGGSGDGESEPRRIARRVAVEQPRRAVRVGEDADIVATSFNQRRDAWELVVSTPR